jgi:hypothetical protein
MYKASDIEKLNNLFKEFLKYGKLYIEAIGLGDKNLTSEQFTAIKTVREIATKSIPNVLAQMFASDKYETDGSIGQGRVASTPWVAIRNKKMFGRKDDRIKASIVFFLSSNIDKVYVSMDLRASDFKNTGKKQLASIRKFSEDASSVIEGPIAVIDNNELDIRNESYKAAAVFSCEWNLTEAEQNIPLLQSLEKAYDIFCDIQSSDSPIAPNYNIEITNTSHKGNKSMTTSTSNENSQNEGFTPIQKIYFGTPGGGKSHKVKTLIEDTKKAKDRYFRTTFHPDTDYASFVGSYKPIMKGELICYEYVPQVFTLAYIAAWNDPDNEYFLDIEEINRGNCAQIFGDLFQLLDRNKEGYSEFPIQADSDLANYLLNAKDDENNDILSNKDGIENNKLCLPPNLSIVATMNTSDQSLFPMDSAFKRRWDWEFVPSTFNEKDNFNITIGHKVYKWHTFLKEANARIKQATDSEDKQMGSYFVKTDMDEEKFKSKVMYYLWSEICKEEYKTQNNFFRYIDQDNNEQEFTFNELYDKGSTKMLQKFMKFMNVSPVNGDNPDEEDKQETEE